MEKETINIPSIELEWSCWICWNQLKNDLSMVPGISGVYEVKLINENEEMLHIGRSKEQGLRERIRKMLNGRNHSSGERIIAHEDITKVYVRWAVTDRPFAVEEELHLCYHHNHQEHPPKHDKRA